MHVLKVDSRTVLALSVLTQTWARGPSVELNWKHA